jgi:MerR family transcriptional regulator, light-induced transcriptional regulator
MVAACGAAEGWGITYLGPDLPVADLLAAARDTGARAVALSIVYSSADEPLLSALRAARRGLSEGTPLLVGGAAAGHLREPLEDLGAIVLDSLAELRARLRQLGEAE